GDPGLSGVSAVILDEFHERHLYGDVSLARLKLLQEAERPDLALIVMSATLDMEDLKSYLDPCVVLVSKGRTFPVDLVYRPPRDRLQRSGVWDDVVRACEWAVIEEKRAGDILVFLPGA
ncbi:MAG: ATP-dependent helicase HrpB, partial [Hyphomicrobiales bacterium]